MADQKLTAVRVSKPFVSPLANNDLLYLVQDTATTADERAISGEELRGEIPSGAPGGRLTLTSGTPVTTSDVGSVTDVYYTPYLNDEITLWDGAYWHRVTFTEQTLALGTVTSGRPYDVFGYLSSGALALEKLAWTSTSARATGISIQGRGYCKTGDKTRLYLGTIMPDSTTTVKDGLLYRGVYNMYNRVKRVVGITDVTSHTNTNTAVAYWNSSSANKVEFILGLLEEDVIYNYLVQMTCAATSSASQGCVGVGVNSTSTLTSAIYWASAFNARGFGTRAIYTTLGYNYLACLERGLTGVTFETIQLSAEVMM